MRKTALPVLIATLSAALAIAGCGSDDDDSSASSDGPDKVTVGIIPIVDVAPIYLGKEKGFFKKRDIDVTLQPGSGGAASIPGVVSGQFKFAFGNVTSLLVARDQDLPLKVIANGVSSTGERGKDFGAVVVPKDSPIRSAADLAGKTVAVNNLKNIGDTTVRQSIRKAGGDPSDVKFVELAFPDMPAAVEGKKVDAAWVVEPFLTASRDQGARVVAWNFVDTAPDLPIATYFTTEETEATEADLVKRFSDAMNESLEYAEAHPDEVRKILLDYTEIPPEVAERITLPKWPTEINRQAIDTLAGLVAKDGTVENEPDVDSLLP